MRLVIRQRVFAFMDRFDIYDVTGKMAYQVKSEFDFGHHFCIFDTTQKKVAEIEETSRLPHTFEIYEYGKYCGSIVKKIFWSEYSISMKGYSMEGDIFSLDFTVKKNGRSVGSISRSYIGLSDAYQVDANDDCILDVLLLALAVDAVRCDHSH